MLQRMSKTSFKIRSDPEASQSFQKNSKNSTTRDRNKHMVRDSIGFVAGASETWQVTTSASVLHKILRTAIVFNSFQSKSIRGNVDSGSELQKD